MFTLYIHCLEVLAMNSEGTTIAKIVDMGCEYSRQKVGYALYELEQEGYVTRDTSGKAHVWQITEKACEYCERIARLYNASHIMDEIAAYVSNMPSDDTKQGVTKVSETPAPLNIVGCEEVALEVDYYTQISGRCEECDKLVERHFALCDVCLQAAKILNGADAEALYALPVGTIPHLQNNHPLPPFNHASYGDIPF